MITFSGKGDFSKTTKLLTKMLITSKNINLDKYGERGVKLLQSATPKESGLTANSWSYEIKKENGRTVITWVNSHISNGINIAIILQYGHGTRNGGWVEGRDYINSSMKPLFDEMAESAWKEVIK